MQYYSAAENVLKELPTTKLDEKMSSFSIRTTIFGEVIQVDN